MRERVIYGGIAGAIFLAFLWLGHLPFQLFVGVLAMIGISELFKMKDLEIFSFEGVLAMLAADGSYGDLSDLPALGCQLDLFWSHQLYAFGRNSF